MNVGFQTWNDAILKWHPCAKVHLHFAVNTTTSHNNLFFPFRHLAPSPHKIRGCICEGPHPGFTHRSWPVLAMGWGALKPWSVRIRTAKAKLEDLRSLQAGQTVRCPSAQASKSPVTKRFGKCSAPPSSCRGRTPRVNIWNQMYLSIGRATFFHYYKSPGSTYSG